ncbi:hypothetical protein ACVW00_000645 [Marmoricola sp. URHA0025 HA25]
MRAKLLVAARSIEPALGREVLGPSGTLDDDLIDTCTTTTSRAVAVRSGPRAAVYVTWDLRGRCLYVGSVRRSRSRAAARDRLREHLRDPERLASWYAVSVLPLRLDLGLEVVRLCEGWVAGELRPRDGVAHPAISLDITVQRALSG